MMSNNISSEADEQNFKAHASSLAEIWLNLMLKRQYQDASELCIDFIEDYGSVFKRRGFEIDEGKYNNLLVLLVFFKGLHEYVQLCHTTQNRNWHKDNSTVEYVWIKLCDCRERLEFASQYCQGKVIDRVFYDLKGLKNFFRDAFGSGTYLSPGIVADGSYCNICHQDFRACSHIAGRLYNGTICYYQQVNPKINHLALVKIPKDPRCRIWDWYIVKDNNNGDKSIRIEKVCFLTSFSVDDFLEGIES